MKKNRGVERILKWFLQRLDESERHHNELMTVVALHRHRASLETLLATQFVLSLAVMWEAFVSDLIVTYVSVSPGTYLQNLEKRIEKSLNDKFGPGIAKRMKFTPPPKFNRAVAHSFSHLSRNVTATSAQDLADRANEFLTGSLARKFSFVPTTECLLTCFSASGIFLAIEVSNPCRCSRNQWQI